ncbi:MAG TPA: hypothetical protein VLT10_00340 [Verrucomicrobiae bacterium]|nr:hypothetical protein [Verrucomicrobiae bacterium]
MQTEDGKQYVITNQSQNQKQSQIGLILGLLEEGNRNKRWLVKEIKRQGLDILHSASDKEMNSYEILNRCPEEIITKLLQTLRGDDIAIPDGIQTKTYHWFFSDIVGGSNPAIRTKDQVRKIVILNDMISASDVFKKRDQKSTIILPTGDGMAIGFADSPEQPVLLSIDIHKALSKYNQSKRGWGKLLLRIGIESGPVYFVKDLEKRDGVWGPGIILTRRIMDLAGDMQIYLGSRSAQELVRANPDYKKMLHFVENFETAYGEKIPLYNMYWEDFGVKNAVKKKEPVKIKTAESSFAFEKMSLEIEVTDYKKMTAHHTWVWNLVNVSKETKSEVFYYINGQIPKKFGSLNIRITDLKDGKKLKIAKISLDRPLRKEFFVALRKQVKPRGNLSLKMEFDWEMPDRMLTYKFPSSVKKFSYVCRLPKQMDVKSTILKTDVDTGQKIHVTPPPVVKMQKENTVISWEKSSIRPREAYQFRW